MTVTTQELKKVAQIVRTLSMDGVEKANSGHPGMPMGSADMATVLWANYLRFNPKDPNWVGRDRFVLSAGHGSMLLYSLLHLFGYEVSMNDLQSFRQWESKTPGHPEFGVTAGVETTTGPLGAGLSNAVGMALSSKMLEARMGSALFSSRVFGIVGDGDLMEGVASEAASMAGHLALGNLIFLYDDNLISLAGHTKECFTESVPDRFKAYGWHVESCDGHNMEAVAAALDKAVKETGRPSLICCRTLIGFGSPNKADTHDVHGSPLGKDELLATKKALGASEEMFFVPEEVRTLCKSIVSHKESAAQSWSKEFDSWKKSSPDKAKELNSILTREVPAQLKDELLKAFADAKKDATRNMSHRALNVISKHVPSFIGGSADLEPSTKTLIKDGKDVQVGQYEGKNIRYGVREHGMGGLANGLAYTQSWIPYTATFLVFSDYMRPTLRLAALSHIQTLFIFTHDSFWVGEDGPTHEPIEHVQSLRIIPNLYVYRPADGLEVAMCYWGALNKKNRPSSLIFTRQNVPPLSRGAKFTADDVLKGGYVLSGDENPEICIVATGSEVGVAVEAADKLRAETKKRISVVSMPCVELFMEQPEGYRKSVIPPCAKRVSIEAGTTIGWERIVGSDALLIGIDHFGASAPGELLAEKFGFTPQAVTDKIRGWI